MYKNIIKIKPLASRAFMARGCAPSAVFAGKNKIHSVSGYHGKGSINSNSNSEEIHFDQITSELGVFEGSIKHLNLSEEQEIESENKFFGQKDSWEGFSEKENIEEMVSLTI
ncbi:hypothetical protein AYI70_g379 [Smittium culicis]|uniref:Uncharacterized protein n=1 Tax=Smittium culicis TaxID=133412 RepID=A0A1R1YGZ1_9FUNG|nr:hypothetical protein AYI70_g379 [Smittium culicis]